MGARPTATKGVPITSSLTSRPSRVTLLWSPREPVTDPFSESPPEICTPGCNLSSAVASSRKRLGRSWTCFVVMTLPILVSVDRVDRTLADRLYLDLLCRAANLQAGVLRLGHTYTEV
jgi:hypothetical protein